MRVELNEAHQREHVPWDGDQLWPMIKSGDTLYFVWKCSGHPYCLMVDTIDLASSEITVKMHNNTRWELKVCTQVYIHLNYFRENSVRLNKIVSYDVDSRDGECETSVHLGNTCGRHRMV